MREPAIDEHGGPGGAAGRPAVKAALDFPFDGAPDPGATRAVAPGVHWIRMPLPIAGLSSINLWALEDDGGWTVVDTGVNTAALRDLWQQLFAGSLASRPLRRIICTHCHADHIGLAGWLSREYGAPLWMTALEWSFGRMLWLEGAPEVPAEVMEFYRRIGFAEDDLERQSRGGFDRFRRGVSAIPRTFRRLTDGQAITIGGRTWEVIVGRGHSPEHAALYAADGHVLISGDQVLPSISPHIGVAAAEPDADPLRLYLDSLGAFRRLPADTLVLPSHGKPFRGLHGRLDELLAHHQERLDRLFAACVEPFSAVDLVPALFQRRIDDSNRFLAVGETLAHVNRLLGEGRLTQVLGSDGIFRYRQGEPAADAA